MASSLHPGGAAMTGDRGRPSAGGFGPVTPAQPGESSSDKVGPVDHLAHGDPALASWATFSLWTAVTPLRGVGGFYDDRSIWTDKRTEWLFRIFTLGIAACPGGRHEC